jgi:cell division cycle 20-like protein 1 (cofactor of APC complex)
MTYYDRLHPAISPAGAIQYQIPDAPLTRPPAGETMSSDELYREALYQACFDEPRRNAPGRIFTYRPIRQQAKLAERAMALFQQRPQQLYTRALSADKIFHAQDLNDDFYCTAITTPATGPNRVAAILGNIVSISPATPGAESIDLVNVSEDGVPTSIHWHSIKNILITGSSNGLVCTTDLNRVETTDQWSFNQGRIGCSTTSGPSQYILGSRAGSIIQVDLRDDGMPIRLGSHAQEVCGLALSPDGKHLASGGNDNRVKIWDLRAPDRPVTRFNVHKAAVKALLWAPWQRGLLFAGGGTADKTIKLLSVVNSSVISEESSVDAQVTALHLGPDPETLVSCHGYTYNGAVLWKHKRGALTTIGTLEGHFGRILHSAMMPDGGTLVTGATDKTIRYWKLFQKTKAPTRSFSRFEIR